MVYVMPPSRKELNILCFDYCRFFPVRTTCYIYLYLVLVKDAYLKKKKNKNTFIVIFVSLDMTIR